MNRFRLLPRLYVYCHNNVKPFLPAFCNRQLHGASSENAVSIWEQRV
jgi:hypothetical protein